MNPRCTLPEELREGALLEFNRIGMSAEEEARIRDLFPQYLFFRNEYTDDGWNVSSDPIRLCTCTNCGESFEAVRGNYARGKLHHERCNCPHCMKEVEGIAAHKYKYDMKSLESWVKTAIARPGKDGALLIEAGNARRRFNWDNLTGTIDWYPTKRYYFGRSGCVEFEERRIYDGCGPLAGWEDVWKATKTISEPFPPNCMGAYNNYYGEYTITGLSEALDESFLKYCQIVPFYHFNFGADLDGGDLARWMVKYLGWACVYPQIEMAVKLGLDDAVEQLIRDGKQNAKYLKWTATKPAELIRLDAQEAKAFFRAGMNLSNLIDWKDAAAAGMKLNEYLELSGRMGSKDATAEFMTCCRAAGCSAKKGERYVSRLMPACARYAPTPGQIVRVWKDYLSMAVKLHYDLSDPTVAMPKDLQERHDAASELIKVSANQEAMKKYRKRRRELEKKYAFGLGDLCVLVPVSGDEIVREGQTLHHCVAGYASRHLSGATTILFIRHRKKPGRSFLTVELEEKKGKVTIRQIHGYKNEGYKGAVRPEKRFGDFLDTWLRWVNDGSVRDRNGLPVLPAADTIETEVKTA